MKRVLVTGGRGLFGCTLIDYLRARDYAVIAHSRSDPEFSGDLTDAAAARTLIARSGPDFVVNLAALTNVDECEQYPQRAFQSNTRIVENLAAGIRVAQHRAHLVQISTDQIYDGPGPHAEDAVTMTNYYAFSKYAGELAAAQVPSTVLRTNFFGPSRCAGRVSFSDWLVNSLRGRKSIRVFDDVLFSPLSMERLAEMVAIVIDRRVPGVFNLGSRDGMSKADFCFALAAKVGLPVETMTRGASTDVNLRAYRPKDMRMNCDRFEAAFGVRLPVLAEEIDLLEASTVLLPERTFKIDGREIGEDCPTYFIADIAANHDGDLQRAKALIRMAAEAGADAAKFQHFSAETIVSDHGFRVLGGQQSHQAKWQKSVFDVYREAAVSMDWTPELVRTAKEAGIAFFTSPYSIDIVNQVDPHVPAYKIGSGDITWTEIIQHIASKQKPYILAVGASSMDDVARAVATGLQINSQMALLQCNTNYTASLENFRFIQLNVLKSFREMYPRMILGLSDHTPGHATVLGAVTLGARIVEKHFTDDTQRTGPDHLFSMDPRTWSEMVNRTRELENALGTGIKKVEENEKETVILQRRAIRLRADVPAGAVLTSEHITMLRPSPSDGIAPYRVAEVLGRRSRRVLKNGEHLKWTDLE